MSSATTFKTGLRPAALSIAVAPPGDAANFGGVPTTATGPLFRAPSFHSESDSHCPAPDPTSGPTRRSNRGTLPLVKLACSTAAASVAVVLGTDSPSSAAASRTLRLSRRFSLETYWECETSTSAPVTSRPMISVATGSQ